VISSIRRCWQCYRGGADGIGQSDKSAVAATDTVLQAIGKLQAQPLWR
jgi:hypothetical protein